MADEEKPKIRWQTVALAVFWVFVLVVIAWGSGFVRETFEGCHSSVMAPWLTRVFLRVRPTAWTVVGVLGAGAIVVKSGLIPRERARLIDRIALGLLILLVITAVLALVVPFDAMREQVLSR